MRTESRIARIILEARGGRLVTGVSDKGCDPCRSENRKKRSLRDLLAERVAKNTRPAKSEEVQNSFTVLHLGNSLR
jgi:hypothetical protein